MGVPFLVTVFASFWRHATPDICVYPMIFLALSMITRPSSQKLLPICSAFIQRGNESNLHKQSADRKWKLSRGDLKSCRWKLQKIEFVTCWILFMMNLPPLYVLQNSSTIELIFDVSVLYSRLSLVTRFIAYVVDFSTAFSKNCSPSKTILFKGVPLWLILHHGGVYASHYLTAFPLAAQNHMQCALCMVCLQSSHNTWTKKYSKAIYWSNVAFGTLSTYVYIFTKFHEGHGVLKFFGYMFGVDAGIILLWFDSI